MRTIKSQDGKTIVNAKKFVCVDTDESCRVFAWDPCCGHKGNITSVWLGKYFNETRALKALDMLNEWLTAVPFSRTKEHMLFQMPQDNENLEVQDGKVD